MSRTVFILGAGASAEAGVPLMNEFLDRAEDIQKTLTDERLQVIYQQVFEALEDLRTIHAKCRLDTNNIEEVLSTFDMARILGKLGKMDESAISSTYANIKEFIASVVERTTAYIKDDNSPHYQPLGPLRSFAAFVKILEEAERHEHGNNYKRRTSIITFNYDTAIESALEIQGINSDYCLEGPPSQPLIPILKLHGSINWGICSKEGCGKIAASEKSRSAIYKSGNKYYFAGKPEKAVHHNPPSGNPVPEIVPPTWYKTQPSASLLNVWRNAISELSDANEIVIIGYSLPTSDNFFKYLFAIGTNSASRIRKFWVCNPSKDVIEKFRQLIGASVAGFTPLEMGFGDFITSDKRNSLLQ